MRKATILMTFGAALALAVSATPSHAQAGVRRAAAAASRQGAGKRRAEMREKFKNLTPEQKAALKDYEKTAAAERKSLAAQVKAGTLTKATAAEQLKAWRAANPLPKP
jgi:Spy/CpxP family protein refolding chaperone